MNIDLSPLIYPNCRNFNFLFILRLLEMESLSGNWLQWMEMIWSVVKQMRFALRGFAVKIPIWLGLVF